MIAKISARSTFGRLAVAAAAGALFLPLSSGVASAQTPIFTPPPVTRQPLPEPAAGHRVVTRPSSLAAPSAAAPQIAAKAAAAAKVTGSTYFSYTSPAGDWVGGGGGQTLKPSATTTVSITGTTTHIAVAAYNNDYSTWWYADLSAGNGDTLHPGSYVNAERDPFRTGRSPGVDVEGDGRGCNEVYGSFVVNQIGFDADGVLNLADVTLTQHCETSSAPAFKGTIHLNQLPLSYHQASDTGDYVGGGVTKTYLNSTSVLSVAGDASRVNVSISGLRDWWYAMLSAPDGTKFVVGKTYQTARFEDDTLAGLDVFGNGAGCNESTGTLTIKKLILGPDGSVANLSADFVQHCEGATPALHGTLHYFA